MDLDPLVFGEEPLQVLFRLLHRFPSAQAPAMGAAVDVGVYRKGGDAESLRHHDGGRFMADARQSF